MGAFSGGDEPLLTLTAPGASDVDARIRAAALRCILRRGVRRTTLDDVARDAGCSRATIYRTFPGGKDEVMAAAAEAELARLLDQLGREVARTETLVDALVAAIVGSAGAVLGHDAVRYLWVHEPDVVRPHLAFDGLDPVLDRAVHFLAPHLERHLDPSSARRTAEWAARLVVVYAGPGSPFDLTDPADARQLVVTYVLPGHGLSGFPAPGPPDHRSTVA